MANTLDLALSTKLSPFLHKKWCIGFSGGVDSSVLYHRLKALFPSKKMTLLHVHHGVSNQADAWAEHAIEIAKSYLDECSVIKVFPKNTSEGILRECRYLAFDDAMKDCENSILILAHHQDDQKETVLWRFLRGSPLSGLEGMKESIERNHLQILRPLLNVPKKDILAYAQTQNLVFVEDLSNYETHLSRNFLRQKVFKELPFIDGIAKTLDYIASSQQALRFFLKKEGVDFSSPYHIEIPLSLENQPLLMEQVLCLWLEQHAHLSPSLDGLRDFLRRIALKQEACLNFHEMTLFWEKGVIWMVKDFESLKNDSKAQSYRLEKEWSFSQGLYLFEGHVHLYENALIRVRPLKAREKLKTPCGLLLQSDRLFRELKIGPKRRFLCLAVFNEYDELLSYEEMIFAHKNDLSKNRIVIKKIQRNN